MQTMKGRSPIWENLGTRLDRIRTWNPGRSTKGIGLREVHNWEELGRRLLVWKKVTSFPNSRRYNQSLTNTWGSFLEALSLSSWVGLAAPGAKHSASLGLVPLGIGRGCIDGEMRHPGLGSPGFETPKRWTSAVRWSCATWLWMRHWL